LLRERNSVIAIWTYWRGNQRISSGGLAAAVAEDHIAYERVENYNVYEILAADSLQMKQLVTIGTTVCCIWRATPSADHGGCAA
jgi:hypothetical protein